MTAPELEDRRVVVLLSTAVFYERYLPRDYVHFEPPGRQWSGWHVGVDVFNAILQNAGHWHPERA